MLGFMRLRLFPRIFPSPRVLSISRVPSILPAPLFKVLVLLPTAILARVVPRSLMEKVTQVVAVQPSMARPPLLLSEPRHKIRVEPVDVRDLVGVMATGRVRDH